MHARKGLAALAAAIIMAIAAQAASAGRLSLSERGIRMVWTAMKFESAGAVNCPVTLEGTFHNATFMKSMGALVGHITRASLKGANAAGSCTGGTATVLQEELPWHIRYFTFDGTLPRILTASFAFIGASFRVQPAMQMTACLAVSEAVTPMVGKMVMEPGGTIAGFSWDERFKILLEAGLCAFSTELTVGGGGTFKRLGTTTNVTLRLI